MASVCSRCGKKFDSERGLRAHVKAKHRGYFLARFVSPYLLVGALLVVGIVYASPYLVQPRQTPASTFDKESLLNTYLDAHQNIVMHIHAKLKILVDGEEVKVPANIGVAQDGRMKVIHTHDETGYIHVESPVYASFTLGDFLKVWGKTFTNTCFDNHCGAVKVTVNSVETQDPLNHILKDRDEIIIEVKRN